MKPQKNRFIAITAVSVALTISAFAADGTWDTTTNGALWTLNTNWAGSNIADGSGSTADFNQVDISGATTVNLNGNRTIGNLIFGDANTGSAGSWTLAGGSDVLTLAGATPTITVNALASPGDYGASATISAGLAGTSGLTKEGTGRLILAGGTANIFSGPITVNAGMLGSLNSASLQNVAGAITVASGATFDAKAGFGVNITNNFTLSGTGSGTSNYGTVYGALNIRENANLTGAITLAGNTLITHDWNIATVSGSITGTNTNLELKTLQAGQFGFFLNGAISLGTGSLTLTGVGTSGSPDFTLSGAKSYTGGTLLKGGRVSINNASSLGSGTVTFVSDTSLASTASMTHANALTVNSGVAATLNVATSTTFDQSGAVTGAGSLTKSGLGTATLSGGTSNTLSGPINVSAGLLGSLNSASLQNVTGAITVASGASFDAKALFGANITNNFTLSGNGSGIFNYGALNIRENANLTGAITLAANTRITHDWNIATISGSITGTNTNLELQTLQPSQFGFFVSAPISLGTGALSLTGIGTSGSPDLTLSGNNTFTGGLVINNGVVRLNSVGALNSTAGSENAVTFGASTTGKLALNGRSYVISNLASNATPGSPVVENGNATAVTLTVGNSQNLSGTYAGVIQNGAGGGALSLTKSGTGTMTLSGANTYTGATLISGGTLKLDATGTINNTSGITIGAGEFNHNSATALSQGVSFSGTGGKLSGNGTIIPNVSVTTGNTLAIGNSVGQMNFGGNLTVGGTYLYELTGGGATADLGDVTGTLTLGGILDLVQIGTYTNGDKFTLFAYDGALTGTFTDTFSSVLSDGGTFTDAGGIWMIDYNDATAGANGGVSASNTYVTITAIPEPNVAALLSGLGVLALLRRRR